VIKRELKPQQGGFSPQTNMRSNFNFSRRPIFLPAQTSFGMRKK